MQFVPLYRQQSGANLEPLPQIISLVRGKSTSAVAPNLVPCASPSRFCAPQLRLPSRPWPPALARTHRGSSAAELFSVFGAPPSRRFHFRPRFRQSCCRAVRGNRRRRRDACPVLHPTPPVTPCSSEGLSEPAPPLLWLCGNHVHLQFSSSRATLISNIRSLSIGI